MEPGPVAVLQVIPVSALGHLAGADFGARPDQIGQWLKPLYMKASRSRPNLDGAFAWCSGGDESESCSGYVQLFRNGMVETADADLLSNGGCDVGGVPGIAFEQSVLEAARRYLDLQEHLGVGTPVLICISLLNVAGLGMLTDNTPGLRASNRFDRDDCLIPEVWVEDYTADVGKALRPAFDAVWHAAGWPSGSPNYNGEGSWTEKGPR
jgi:hypothetical protein